jgi:GTP cyclohydrolase III
MKVYDIHVYIPVRVKVAQMCANTPSDAIQRALIVAAQELNNAGIETKAQVERDQFHAQVVALEVQDEPCDYCVVDEIDHEGQIERWFWSDLNGNTTNVPPEGR